MNVFTYGSLMYPKVLEALTERSFSFEDITMKDFARHPIAGKKYPGLKRHIGSSVNGRLWFDIDDSSMRMLDCFEDPLYERVTLEILSSTRGLVNACAYIVPQNMKNILTDSPWDPSIFENMYLDQYVEMCGHFRLENLKKCV